jgi:predicted nucleic acid-binding protein
MPFVIDASVTATWALSDEPSPVADRADARLDFDTALVPRIWWYEIRNLLVINERRQRIAAADSDNFLQNLSGYPIEIDQGQDERTLFRLAREHRLSFYDAAYLELAQRHGIPLATLDKALQAAALSASISLLV